MKRKLLQSTLILIVSLLGSTAQAQVFSGGGAPASGGNSGNSGSSNTTVVTKDEGGNKNMMGNVLPFFDPATETMHFEGQMWNLNDNRVLNARFEKYLNSPPADSEEDQAYRIVIGGVRDALSPHNKANGGRINLQKAVALLQEAAQYEQDDRMSESLANMVYRVWLARRQGGELRIANDQLKRQRKDVIRNSTIAGRTSSLSANTDEEEEANNRANDLAANMTELGEYANQYAEIQAQITANVGKIALSDAESRLEFQALMGQFFMQRRFEHVIMATRIYTEFYSDGAGRIELEEGSDAAAAFKETLGVSPTVTALDSLATEAVRDVEDSAEAFTFLVEKGEIASASKRLVEGFTVGEHVAAIQVIPMDQKQEVLEFVQTYNGLLSAIEAKDYKRAEDRTNRLVELAGDFDSSQPMQAIQTAKLTSNMHVRTAVNEALEGDTIKFQEHIAAATEIWPTNPDLEKAFGQMADQGNRQIQTVNDLDRLIATNSFRQIFNDQGRYIGAVADDEVRQSQLREIITNITRIDIAIQQAQKLAQVGDRAGAWETVEQVFKDFPDDPPLSKVRSDLTTEVADFVSALKKAEALEERDQLGSSLTWFLKARQMYPASTFAREGIGRLSDEILPEETAMVDTF